MIGKELKLCCLCNKAPICVIRNYGLKRHLHSSCTQFLFWEPYRKGGQQYEPKQLTFLEHLKLTKNVLHMIKGEFKLLGEEVKEKVTGDLPIVQPGHTELMWKFNHPDVLTNFVVTADKLHNEGYSECKFELNKHKHALFSGVLSTRVPKTGTIVRSGYCAMTSRRPMKAFWRASSWDWMPYTHLTMKIRGDGRTYLINLACEGSFDLTWNDMYNYTLYTRGGPYWQNVKIPFSKFFMSSKGRIQDKQARVPLGRITQFGITLADKVSGPFHLEIDYIGRVYDPSHTEDFAYELYKAPDYTVGV